MSTTSAPSINFEAIDIAHQSLRLIDDLAAWPVWENGRRIYRLECRDSKRFYRVGFREYAFISLLNGQTTVAAACGLAASALGNDALASDEAESIAIWLIEEGMASLAAESGSDAPSGYAAHRSGRVPPDRVASLWSRFNPFWIQIPVIKNVEPLAPIFRSMAKCLHPLWIAIGTLIVAAGILTFFAHSRDVYESASSLFSPSGWMSLLLTWVVLKFIHETGHAIACHRVGGETGELGIVLILFAPLAYVDVSSCWRLPRRSSRLIVSAAGMFVELFVAAIAIFFWRATDDITIRCWLANVVITAGVSTILFNANPLMRFDGYYLLSDLVQIPNLSTEGTLELRRIGRRLFYGEENGGGHYRGLRRIFILLYGVAAVCWRLIICVVLCFSAAVMFSGAGIALAAVGAVGWFGKPIWVVMTTAVENFRFDPMRFIRSFVVASLVLAIGAGCLGFPIPTGVRIAAAVHDAPDSIIRAGSDGFVRQIHVRDGQFVRRGDPLVTLENRSLEEEEKQLRLSIQENAVLNRIAKDRHDASAEWMTQQDLLALEQKIEQVIPKVDALTITAPFDGTISTRELGVLIDCFVHEGDEITRIVRDGGVEVIGLIHQDEIATAKKYVGLPVTIRDVSYRPYQGRLQRIDPRASYQLPDQSLAAPFGGPIQVTKSDTDDPGHDESVFRLVAPHFLARVDLSAAGQNQLKTGSRVRVYLGYRHDSLAQRITTALRHLWHLTRARAKG